MDILDYRHQVILSINPSAGSVYHNDLMSGEYIKVRFNLAKPVILVRGTYIRNEWGWFILTEDYKPKYDKATGGFVYDVQFDAYYYYFSGYILKFRPKFGAVETSFSLTGGIKEHWNVFIENLRYNNLNIYSGEAPCTYREFFDGWAKSHNYGETTKEYERMLAENDCVEIRCEVMFVDEKHKELGLVENTAKGISYDSVKLSDVPGVWCEDDNFKCEWWVKGNVFYFGHLGLDTQKETLEWNLGEECEDMQRSESKEEAATRIIAFGSTRNVPSRYRKDLIFTVVDPSSDNVDDFRVMKAEWFRADTREKVQTPYYSDSEDNESVLAHISPDFPIEDCPNFTLRDAKFEILAPFVGYNTNTGEVISFSEDNLAAMKKLIETSSVEVVEVVKDGDKTQEIIKGKPALSYTYRDEEYYRHYTISVEPCTESTSAMATRLYMRWRINNDYIGTPIGEGYNDEYPQIKSNRFSDNYLRVMFSGTFSNDSFYRVHTTAEVLTGSHTGEKLPVTINQDLRNVTSYESGKIIGLSSLSKGDTYRLENVLTGKVRLAYFTDERASAITNYERRLMLPISSCPNNYIESEDIKDENGNIVEAKIVEVVKVYDDIYPKQELIVNSVEPWKSEEQDPDDPNNPDATIKVIHYRMFIPTTDFDFEVGFLTEDKLECQFQSGQLAGMTFSINFLGKGYGNEEQKEMLCYEVDINNTYGIDLPNEVFFPQNGDKIVFFGYDPSQLSTDDGNMVVSAEMKLEEEARKTLQKIEQDTGRYTCPLMSGYAKGLYDNSSLPEMGDPVRIYNYGYFDTFRNSRVIGMEIKLDIPWDTPKYTIGEDKAYSRSAETAQSIASLTAKMVNGIGGGGGVSETQLREGVEKYGKKMFLSKTEDDTAKGHITFERGITSNGNASFGRDAGSSSFASGLMGNGWRFDNLGHGEVDSLSIRKFLEVPELRYNKISVRTGVQWQTFGAGLIEEVLHPEGLKDNEGVVKLKLEDGEYGAVAFDDLCMGIYHHEGKPNDTANADDHNGNFSFAGFTTVYFRIVGICDEQGSIGSPDPRNQYFRYELRPDWKAGGFDHTSVHPQPSMYFACYGNRTNSERQASVYSSTDYLIMLAGMTDWTYDSRNIFYIRGRLSGFTINTIKGDVALEGYGIAVGKEYRWGTEIVLDRPAQLINQQLYYAASDKDIDAFLKGLSSVAWSSDPLSPSKEKPYLYGYWKKTYLLAGEETTTPEGGRPSAKDVFLQGTYAESGESAVSIVCNPGIVIVDVSVGAWNEEGLGVTVGVASSSTHVIEARVLYGQQPDAIRSVTVGEAQGVTDAHVEIAADALSVRIAFAVTDAFPVGRTTYLPITFHTDHTPVGGYLHDLPVSPAVEGRDGYDGGEGQAGRDAVSTQLSNQTDTIGIGHDGILDVPVDIQTTVTVVCGAQVLPQTSEPIFTGSLAGCSIDTAIERGACIITIHLPEGLVFEPNTAYRHTLTITPVISGADVQPVVFTLVGNTEARDGEMSYLLPSVTSVRQNPDGTFTPAIFRCVAMRKVGTDAPVEVELLPPSEAYSRDGYYIEYDSALSTELLPASGVTIADEVGDEFLFVYLQHRIGGKVYTIDRQSISILKDGEDGKDATLYEVECDHTQVIVNADGDFMPGEITFSFKKTVGNVRTEFVTNAQIIFLDENGNIIHVRGYDITFAGISSKTVTLEDAPFVIWPRYVECRMFINDNHDYKMLSIPIADAAEMGPQGPKGDKGERGDKGINGAVVIPCGEWKENTPYVNEENETKPHREIHVVLCDGDPYQRTTLPYPVIGGKTIYVKPGDASFVVRNISDNTYEYCSCDAEDAMYWNSWWTVTAWDPFVAARLLLAKDAYIQFASGQASYYMDKNNHIRIGVQAETESTGEEQPMLFVGADISSLNNPSANDVPATKAPLRIYKDGTLVSANVNSAFQDLSEYCSVGEMELNIADIRYGKTIVNHKTGASIKPLPRVYNLRCDDTVILLPTAAEYIGQRVLIYNGISSPQRIHGQDGSTSVAQDEGKTFLGVGTVVTSMNQSLEGKPIYKLDEYTEVSRIAFMAGVMEFVAVPDGKGCRWAVINDGVTAKWFDDEFII